MEPNKRQGTDLHQVEQELHTVTEACVWGIEKHFDPKQCYKYFLKNFGSQDITHLCKYRNKPFFAVKFPQPINLDDFNATYAKNKRVKVKAINEGMVFDEYISIEECTRHAEKRDVKATPEALAAVKLMKIEDIVEPLHMLPYKQQVETKVKEIERVLQNYNRAYFKDPEVRRLQAKHIQIPPLKLETMVECTIRREGYRSKSQFTIGVNDEGQPVIGFNKGSFHNQTIMVESCRKVSIISKNTKLIVAVVENFMRTHFQELLPFDRIQQTGFWRYMIVRESQRTQQSLVMLVCKTNGLDPTLLLQLKDSLVQCLRKSIINLTSVFFLAYEGEADSVPNDKPELLFGKDYYEEKILDTVFQVSPSAFLQIHIDMCEVLYREIIAQVQDCDLVLDLGCGIGAIGISVMKKLPHVKVIGVEICAEAVENARRNSEGYEVHLGRAEDLIKGICQSHRGNRIVAILDPPRAGFNKDLIVTLRRCRGLDRIIYVACNAGAIQDNLLQLTLPATERRRAPEFVIHQMKAFDLFPQTAHYEALYVMKRLNT